MNSPEKIRICPLCLSENTNFYLKRKDGLTVYRCNSCDLGFIPLHDLEDLYGRIENLYEEAYFESHADEAVLGYSSYNTMPASGFLWRTAFIELTGAIKDKKTLDIGCATGLLLELMREKGADAEGVEVSGYAAFAAASKGLKVANTDVMSLGSEPLYDIITAFDVIEHVSDVNGFLRKIYSLLRDDGTFIFLVPDSGSEQALAEKERWYGFNSSLEHLYYFSSATLNFIFKKIFGSEPVLFQGATADGQGILGFIRKTPLQSDEALRGLFRSNFSPEFVDENNVMQVCLLLQRLGDGRYLEYLDKYRSISMPPTDSGESTPSLSEREEQK